jgi:copper resistance protein C
MITMSGNFGRAVYTFDRMERLFLVCITALLIPLAVAAPAVAHARLLGTDPADGATVTEPVPTVTLEFNQLIGRPELAVLDPDGQPLTLEPLPSEGQRLVQPLPPLAQPGVYTVTWRVISLDRDPIDGQFSFTYAGPLASPETPSPSPAGEQPEAAEPELAQPAAAEPSASASPWPFVLLAAVMLLAVIVWAVLRLPRRGQHQ